MPKGADGEEGVRTEGLREGELETLLRSQPRLETPPGLWARVAQELRPEAVASRRIARRRRHLVEALVGVAASVMLVVGGWRWSASWSVTPSQIQQVSQVGAGSDQSTGSASALEQEVETLRTVHLVHEAGNVLPEEMVVAVAGYGDEAW